MGSVVLHRLVIELLVEDKHISSIGVNTLATLQRTSPLMSDKDIGHKNITYL